MNVAVNAHQVRQIVIDKRGGPEAVQCVRFWTAPGVCVVGGNHHLNGKAKALKIVLTCLGKVRRQCRDTDQFKASRVQVMAGRQGTRHGRYGPPVVFIKTGPQAIQLFPFELIHVPSIYGPIGVRILLCGIDAERALA